MAIRLECPSPTTGSQNPAPPQPSMHLFTVLAATALLPTAASAGDDFKISPSFTEVCVGDDLNLELCTRPSDIGLLLVAHSTGTTLIPGIGTFGVALDPFPTLLELGAFPGTGCLDLSPLVPCDCTPTTFYLQGVSINPIDLSIVISNVSQVDIKSVCQDWDGNGVNDTCDPDCDDDGVIDGLELDSDGDGIPNDCDDEICVVADDPCDGGCWKLLNKPLDSGGPVGTYGFRLDGLFGDHSDNYYTFSFEEPGTDVQVCYDKDSGEVTMVGLVYGGLGLAPAWDADLQGFAILEFTWSGAFCDDDEVVVNKTSGAGSGSFTWLKTGEVIALGPKADSDGDYMTFGKDLIMHSWVSFDGMPEACCQDLKAGAAGLSTCP